MKNIVLVIHISILASIASFFTVSHAASTDDADLGVEPEAAFVSSDTQKLYYALCTYSDDTFNSVSVLSEKVDLNSPLRLDGTMALHTAVIFENPKIVSLLLESGAKPNAYDPNGMTPLAQAAQLGLSQLCELLITHGAHVNLRLSRNSTTLHYAAAQANQCLGGERDYIKTIKVLINHGADRNARNSDGRTPLESAIYRKNAFVIEALRN